MIYRGQAFSRSYDLASPHPLYPPLPLVNGYRKKERQLARGGGGVEGGGRAAGPYDRKKAWSSVNHSILAGNYSKPRETLECFCHRGRYIKMLPQM
jgi:hypothetical protein